MRPILPLIAIVATLAGCRPTKLAGESLGQFRVTGTLDDTTCGDGYPVPETSTFYVELRREDGSSYGYWKLPNAPLVSGLVDGSGRFRFTDTQEVTGVEPDAAHGVAGCDVTREETVAGTIGDDAADASTNSDAGAPGGLSGTTTIRITPVAGGDCSPLLLPAGGAFPSLPCEVTVQLVGERLATPIF